MLYDHPDTRCKYNPLKLGPDDTYVHESYGLTNDLMSTRDSFHFTKAIYTKEEEKEEL
jgi:hypothetical protein